MVTTSHDLTRTTLALLFLGGLIATSFLVVQPFLAATVWAATLVIATWPLLLKAQAALGGRRGWAVALMTILLLLVVLLPLSLALGAIVTRADELGALLEAALSFRLPPPPLWLVDIPAMGAPIAEKWQHLANAGLADIADLVRPYVGTIAHWFVGALAGAGGIVVHLLLTIAIAAVLFAKGELAADWCRRFGRRLAAERGDQAVTLAGSAIRSVAQGVVVTAVAQSLVAGIGLALSGVPHAGLLTAIILLLCIAQLGPALVVIPAIIWLFATNATMAGILLVAFAVPSLVLDNLLRPVLIRRGADLPLLLILVGVVGGLLSFGLLGLFLGPVILAVSYTLLQHWIADDERLASARLQAGHESSPTHERPIEPAPAMIPQPSSADVIEGA
jgi:predicted PurR-regulated permease PerM